MGEITVADEFGRAIANTVWLFRCSRIIEVGSWDGSGSTSVLIAAMKGLDNPSLTCLEPNPERHARLQRIAAPIPWVKTVCRPSISAGGYTPRTFADVWESPFNRLRYPREQVEGWWNETIANATSEKGYLETLTDERWDAALIDGCEFAGYDDYRLLKERVRVLMLDDAFTAYKCAQADDELSRDSRWSCIWRSAFVRSGASIWVKH